MESTLLQEHPQRTNEFADPHVGHGDEEGQGVRGLEGTLCEEGAEDVGQNLRCNILSVN